MSHQRYVSQDIAKEPHPVSLKVLRLSRPSLVAQFPVAAPLSSALLPPTVPASLSYRSCTSDSLASSTNTDPFLLSPILNLPPAFGSAYVGESFACTLCVNHDDAAAADGGGGGGGGPARREIRDVRIEAEMKTPSSAGVVKLVLTSDGDTSTSHGSSQGEGAPGRSLVTVGSGGVDLAAGETLQKIVQFDLKEEGNHVLAVTVSYYEATGTSGRTRTFRKLYQFICKPCLIVRTKAGPYPALSAGSKTPARRWVLEAQLENCGEDVIQLDQLVLQLEPALTYEDCNPWVAHKPEDSMAAATGLPARPFIRGGSEKPILHPGEVEQVSFLIEEMAPGLQEQGKGRLVFGILGIGWRGEMGNRGFLSTGKLGTRVAA